MKRIRIEVSYIEKPLSHETVVHSARFDEGCITLRDRRTGYIREFSRSETIAIARLFKEFRELIGD